MPRVELAAACGIVCPLAMKEVSSSNFGILIAFILPGFVVLWGASYFSETVRLWLSGTDSTTPTVGGFMYVTLASVAAGMTASTVRWAVIDSIHRWTGLPQPAWDFSRLQENLTAYTVLNDIHYKFYQFHGNAEVALVFVYLARRVHLGFFAAPLDLIDAGFLMLAVILFIGSRDTLAKYYSRVSQLLGDGTSQNGIGPVTLERQRLRRAPLASGSHRGPHNPLIQSSSKNRSSLSLGR
jgi:hypothetical protein